MFVVCFYKNDVLDCFRTLYCDRNSSRSDSCLVSSSTEKGPEFYSALAVNKMNLIKLPNYPMSYFLHVVSP